MPKELTPEEKQASEFVTKELAKGASKAVIVKALMKQGWFEETATEFVDTIVGNIEQEVIRERSTKSARYAPVLRGILSLVLAFVIYVLVSVLIRTLLQRRLYDVLDSPSLQVMFIYGLASFSAFFVGLAVMTKRYRAIVGGLLLSFLFAWQLYDMSLNITQFWAFVGSLIRLSVNAFGAILAVSISISPGSSGADKRHVTKGAVGREWRPLRKNRKPRASLFLLTLALLSVPATYMVIILSAFIALGLSVWSLFVVFELEVVPLIVLLALVIAPFVSFWVAVRALRTMLAPAPDFQPAVQIDLQQCPSLSSMIQDVCGKVKTRQPDIVILDAEPTFFVLQGKVLIFDGVIRGRVLAIGAPLVRELETSEFMAILAHEFAHFSGRDTAYSAYVAPAYRAITSSLSDLEGISEASTSTLMGLVNVLLFIPRLFLRVFATYFGTIDSLLRRGRELRADWISAEIYGSENLSTALTMVAQIASHFTEHSQDIASKEKASFFEEYSRVLHKSPSELEEYKNKALAEVEESFDTHPTLSTRIRNLPTNELGGGDRSLIVRARQELLEKERGLSSQYIAYVETAKEMYEEVLRMIQGGTSDG